MASERNPMSQPPTGSDMNERQNLCISDTIIERAERITPSQANYHQHQNVHGGEMVRQMDDLAAVSAMTLAGKRCVTAHISRVDFKEPIPVGHLAEMTAYVYDTGETSLKVYVSVDHRDPRTHDRSRATEARFLFVAIDESGEPQTVPNVRIEHPIDKDLLERVPRRSKPTVEDPNPEGETGHTKSRHEGDGE